jgi:hypothetical protein
VRTNFFRDPHLFAPVSQYKGGRAGERRDNEMKDDGIYFKD